MPDGTAPPRAGWRRNRKRLLGGIAMVLVAGAVFIFVLPRIADYRDVWDVLEDMGFN